MKFRAKTKYVIGVDEAGRGPLAGPVVVAAMMWPRNFQFLRSGGLASAKQNFKFPKSKLKDSKKLSAKQREEWFEFLNNHPEIFYAAASVSASVIDKIGIQKAIKLAVNRSLVKLTSAAKLTSAWRLNRQAESLPTRTPIRTSHVRKIRTCDVRIKDMEVLLDGLLRAPDEYRQKTIIKGDELVPVISAASIIAKVTRDRKMARLHKKTPLYGFDRHKGYGTKAHYAAIKKYGLSPEHRKCYCRFINTMG